MIKFSIWSKAEKFLVLEVTPHQTEGLLLSLDPSKNIKLEKFWNNFNVADISQKLRRNLAKWKIIIAADPSLAYTTLVPIRMERDENRYREPILGVEIENLLSQATARIYNRCRREASAVLGVEELDTVLIGNRVSNFQVDGHRVINPIDFQARRVDAILELTLTTRSIFEEWKNFFSIGPRQNFFFTESAKAELTVLSKLVSLPINLIMLRREGSHYFTLEPQGVGFGIRRGKIEWPVHSFLKTIASSWEVDPGIARSIYQNYLRGEMSEGLLRHFAKEFRKNLAEFFSQSVKAKLRGPVFIETHLPLPINFPKRQGHLVLEDLPLDIALEKLGFAVESPKWPPWTSSRTFRHLAPFLEFYYNSKDIPINYWLRRRLHWLGAK